MLERALADVASLRRERRGYRAQLDELLRDAFQLCDEDGSGEVDAEECIKLDKEIAAVSGREYDEEATKGVRISDIHWVCPCACLLLLCTGKPTYVDRARVSAGI